MVLGETAMLSITDRRPPPAFGPAAVTRRTFFLAPSGAPGSDAVLFALRCFRRL